MDLMERGPESDADDDGADDDGADDAGGKGSGAGDDESGSKRSRPKPYSLTERFVLLVLFAMLFASGLKGAVRKGGVILYSLDGFIFFVLSSVGLWNSIHSRRVRRFLDPDVTAALIIISCVVYAVWWPWSK